MFGGTGASSVGCRGTVLVHEDHALTCTAGRCDLTDQRVATDRHLRTVPCHLVAWPAGRCPRCYPAPLLRGDGD